MLALRLNLRIKYKIVAVEIIVDNPSDTGIADHAPVRPYIGGRINKQGTRNKNCRVRLRKIDILAFPMDWKKLVITI